MGNKAAGGPFQLEVPSGEAPGFQVGAMEGNARSEGCVVAVQQQGGAGEASDGSGDDERAYASPVEVEEELAAEEGTRTGAAISVAPASDERAEDSMNFTRNNSQSSIGNSRLLESPNARVVALSLRASPLAEGPVMVAPATVDGRPIGRVPPPPPPPMPSSVSAPAPASASPPRVPGANELQLPPLNDPHPLPLSEEATRLAVRGSPTSADGRDQKGAQ